MKITYDKGAVLIALVYFLAVIFHWIPLVYAEGIQPVVYERPKEKPVEVLIEVEIDWTKERIIKEIRDTFPENPNTFVNIAKCESNFLPSAHNPTNGSHDGGIYQISQKYHGKELKEMGLDPYKVEDNLKFARLLYEEQGLAPWVWSKHCWNK